MCDFQLCGWWKDAEIGNATLLPNMWVLALLAVNGSFCVGTRSKVGCRWRVVPMSGGRKEWGEEWGGYVTRAR